MFNIGCHLSSSKGYLHMGQEARSIGANTFQFFTRNPRGSKAKALNEKDMQAMVKLAGESKFAPILGHAPYTLNPCAPEPRVREFAMMVFIDDLIRMEHLPHNLYNFHPGNHGGQGVDAGIDLLTGLLSQVLQPGLTTRVLLETMSGKGRELGSSFEELKSILDRVELSEVMGICMDTCHVFAAGYDIVNNLDGVLEEFDNTIGLDKLKAIHLNDSLHPFASQKDRHAALGQGTIGWDAIVRIINHPRLKNLPFFLETPHELPGYQEEIKRLQLAYQG